MAKTNRQRRAAKQRKRTAQRSADHGRATERPNRRNAEHGSPESSPPRPRDPLTLLHAAAHARVDGDDEAFELLVAELAAAPRERVGAVVQRELARLVAECWSRGWQPVVLDRTARRDLDELASTLLATALTVDSAAYDRLGREVAPDWMRQVDSVRVRRRWTRDDTYLTDLPNPWPDIVRAAVMLTVYLHTRPSLPVLSPPPAEWHHGMAITATSSVPSALLDKVRALLAKAESTDFDAEAEVFTAKAQELMTRHRIDRSILQADRQGERETPSGRHVVIENPYPEAKAVLLGVVAGANGGTAVFSKELGFSTVFAQTNELDIIEDLFTSLLVQATAALRRQGSKYDRSGRSRTTRFRRSFLVAFAHRIGERLQDAADGIVADAVSEVGTETGTSLVRILADANEAAHDAATGAFGELGRFRPSASDDEGWRAGELFGDRADLGVGAPVTKRAAS